jgi:hypothetical protein
MISIAARHGGQMLDAQTKTAGFDPGRFASKQVQSDQRFQAA